ncbi:MAG TPA: DUF4384 domain-containing protein [Bryobacteraceae bacterium]|jgi:hypothetical protein
MKPLLIMTLSISSAWAQQPPALHARELFYTPPAATQPPAQPDPPKPPAPKAPAPKPPAKPNPSTTGKAVPKTPGAGEHSVDVAMPLGLRYSILKRGADNQFSEVAADTMFKSGDRVRFQVKTNTTGYLYIVMQGSSGTWKLLFPAQEVAGGSNLVQPGELRTVPPGDRGQFVFDDQAGTEKLFVVLTRQPEPDLDKLIYAMGGPRTTAEPRNVMVAGNTVSDDVVNRLRKEMASRDLVFETSDQDPTGKPEKAAYVANPSTATDARLVVDISLRHK